MGKWKGNGKIQVKWWYRYNDPKIQGKWKSLLLAKYGSHCSQTRIYYFWKGIS